MPANMFDASQNGPVPMLPPRADRPAWALHGVAASRAIEAQALASTAAHALMARAGLAVARLAAAVEPHAKRLWLAAGPGNNGGDALVAARHLMAWGRSVQVSWLGDADRLPDDARWALDAARQAGVPIRTDLPDRAAADLCVDGLLGLGAARPPAGAVAAAIERLNAAQAPVLAIDLPSGLDADHGQPLGAAAVRAAHTLSLLTLKPGLFTGIGRDHAGRVWFDGLGLPTPQQMPNAYLGHALRPAARRHAQHKGSFGDVLVLGGAPGMGGAALLAARAALAAGAGRVLLVRLDGQAGVVDSRRPELMPRQLADVMQAAVLATQTVVCGCGGGDAVTSLLPPVLAHAGRLVLDADALNAIAGHPALWSALAGRRAPTVLTPHPLEAARLLACDRAAVQADRLGAAQALAERSRAVVLLKGSGTVVAAPGRLPVVNPSGSGRLATAGSGDVLAGWLGAWLAEDLAWSDGGGGIPTDDTLPAFRAACASAWWHGMAGTGGDCTLPLRADDLPDAMVAALAAASGVHPSALPQTRGQPRDCA